ncbi:hypothetical protein BDZ89DRAFT_1131080 [Hymenopellis radicata]|nr:hypothetical protein BDZ89DRAFT_1131080 [Hymenopellis radicata]
MSSEASSRKKRTVSEDPPKSESEVDHRKRRRNRTTQSCLNCHTSKRMCDRRRPACARCTQLGLTGLCVYEVDDPNQRPDSQDESARLLKRVAELEGVIRELKNKPHPRWSQSGLHTVDSEPLALSSESQMIGDRSSLDMKSVSSKLRRRASPNSGSYPSTPPYPPSISTCHVDGHSPSSQSSYFSASPLSSPSPTLTPVDEYGRPPIKINTGSPSDGLQELDLASMFLSYPGLMSEEVLPSQPPFHKQHNTHCGCLHETSSYGALLELSMRLRKAADALAKSPSHRSGADSSSPLVFPLKLRSTSLGNIVCPPDNLSGGPSHPDVYSIPGRHAMVPATVTPLALHHMSQWGGYLSEASTTNDPLMNWEPSR